MTKLRLGEVTAGEMRALLAERPVLLLPLGSHEDQGPHAPMGDYLCAERVAEHIAARANAAGIRTLVAPVLPFGGADYFGSVPGGLSLSQTTLRAVLSDLFAALLRHDLTRIIVINGHAGNVQAIHDTTQPIWLQRGIMIPSFYLWRVAAGLLADIVGPETAQRAAGHGADPLTSIAMHLFPALMRPDLVPEPGPRPVVHGMTVSGFGSVDFAGAEIALPLEIAHIAPNGVWADPHLASAATGAALVARLSDIGARLVAHVATWPQGTPIAADDQVPQSPGLGCCVQEQGPL
jgi:creatinine amidohydrolase